MALNTLFYKTIVSTVTATNEYNIYYLIYYVFEILGYWLASLTAEPKVVDSAPIQDKLLRDDYVHFFCV